MIGNGDLSADDYVIGRQLVGLVAHNLADVTREDRYTSTLMLAASWPTAEAATPHIQAGEAVIPVATILFGERYWSESPAASESAAVKPPAAG